MKKSLILFLIFLVIDIVLFSVFATRPDIKDPEFYYYSIIILEIAIYGSFVLYETSKKTINRNLIHGLIF